MKRYYLTNACSGFKGYPVISIVDGGKGSAYNKSGFAYDLINYCSGDGLKMWVRSEKMTEVSEEKAMEVLGRAPKKKDTRFNYLSQRRDKGRFAPSRPKELRKGSLYKTANNQVGRYRADAYGNYVVMSEHDKPFVVDRGELRYANNDEVQQYLAKK